MMTHFAEPPTCCVGSGFAARSPRYQLRGLRALHSAGAPGRGCRRTSSTTTSNSARRRRGSSTSPSATDGRAGLGGNCVGGGSVVYVSRPCRRREGSSSNSRQHRPPDCGPSSSAGNSLERFSDRIEEAPRSTSSCVCADSLAAVSVRPARTPVVTGTPVPHVGGATSAPTAALDECPACSSTRSASMLLTICRLL